MEQQKLPNSTLILVFGIISILTCCCYGVIGLIFGIIALILAAKAAKLHFEDTELYTGYQNVKTGKILAIIGVILNVLYLIFVICVISIVGFENIQNEEIIRESLEEFLNQ